MDKKSKTILCTHFSHGRCHDFKLFKQSKVLCPPNTKIIIDTGYRGIEKIHAHTQCPKKKSKKHPLTKEEKRANQECARERILNENIIGCIKRFKVISDRYRNRRKRFGLRFNLICGIYNLECLEAEG